MGKIVGKGATVAPSTISVEEYNEMKESLSNQISTLTTDKGIIEKELATANETINTLTTEKSALEDKIKELEPKSEDPESNDEDPESNDEDPEGKGSNKKTKKDE